MADDDLEQIRRARMQQLQQQGGGGRGGGQGGQGDQEQQKQDRESEARTQMLSQILLPEAADRLGRIRLVKASRAEAVENRLISLARSGQLRQKVTEDQLKDLLAGLAEVEEKSSGAGKITVSRRKGGWDDDDDDLEDLLKDD